MQPTASDISCLDVFPFLAPVITHLQAEVPTYLAKVVDFSAEVDVLLWWRNNASEIPNRSNAAQLIFLIQPSSSASERVFSLLKNSFGSHQLNSLNDYV